MSDLVDLLALCRVKDVSWSFVAREAQRPGGLENLRAGRSSERSTEATRASSFYGRRDRRWTDTGRG